MTVPPCPDRAPTVPQGTAKSGKSDRAPVPLSIRHGHGARLFGVTGTHTRDASVPPAAKVVRAEVVKGGNGRLVVLLDVHCPHCENVHTHGGGESLAGASRYLGHRAAHCAHKASTNHGYVLTDADGLLS